MKILWINPSFLDYRVPVYKRLYELTNGNFYLAYSKQRVPERCIKKIESALGKNALGLKQEKVFSLGPKKDFANSHINLPFPKGLNNLISDVDADIIISEGFFQWTPWALLKSRKNKVPLVIAYERTSHTERNCPKWRYLYRKFISKFVNGYLANGSLTKEYLLSWGIDENKIFIGGMSADSDGMIKDIKNVERKEHSGIIFLYVGRIIELKGLQYLLPVWKKYSATNQDDKLIIVGDGPLLDDFRSLYNDVPSIEFVGAIDYDSIAQYYAKSDVFIIPTLEDNWSLVVPEAMSCGLPIATSIYNGCHVDLVNDGVNGKTFDPLNESSILSCLEFFHNKDLKQMGQKSIEIEKNFNTENVSQRIYNACLNVLNQMTK